MQRRLVPILAFCVGALLMLAGAFCIGAYFHTLISVWGTADRSAAYWYLALLVIGSLLIILGIHFTRAARGAWRGDAPRLAQAGCSLYVLIGALVALTVAAYIRQDRSIEISGEATERETLCRDRQQEARRLLEMEIDLVGNELIRIRNRVSAGLDGTYVWTILVMSNQATFFEQSRSLLLRGPAAGIDRAIDFADIFESCRTETQVSAAYVCAKNAAASEFYTVQSHLQLLEEPCGRVKGRVLLESSTQSSLATTLELHTLTAGDRVTVERVLKSPDK